MSNSEALLPCPFCNGYAVDVRDYRVHCAGCGAFSGWKSSQAEAITAWNTRPSSPAASDGDAMVRAYLRWRDSAGWGSDALSSMTSFAAGYRAALSTQPLASPVSDGGACPKCARGSLTLSSCNECGTRFNVAQSFKAMELSDDVDILLKSADILADELSVLRHTTGISDRARAALADYDASAFKLRRVIRAAKQ